MTMAAILNLLKLVPIKDWLYCALGVAILTGFVAYTVHERHVGAAKIEVKNAALRAASVALNKAAESFAQINEIDIGRIYEKHIYEPAVADAPGLVCRNTAPTAKQPHTADNRPGVTDKATELPDGSFNPSGAILTLLSDDDAQIAGLIDTVNNLVDELNGKH